jgi:hypothetical protein
MTLQVPLVHDSLALFCQHTLGTNFYTWLTRTWRVMNGSLNYKKRKSDPRAAASTMYMRVLLLCGGSIALHFKLSLLPGHFGHSI